MTPTEKEKERSRWGQESAFLLTIINSRFVKYPVVNGVKQDGIMENPVTHHRPLHCFRSGSSAIGILL